MGGAGASSWQARCHMGHTTSRCQGPPTATGKLDERHGRCKDTAEEGQAPGRGKGVYSQSVERVKKKLNFLSPCPVLPCQVLRHEGVISPSLQGTIHGIFNFLRIFEEARFISPSLVIRAVMVGRGFGFSTRERSSCFVFFEVNTRHTWVN